MKLQQLRYLAAIVDAGFNISAAAEKLHLSQPGVSRQLKLLEDELGFELFVRDGRALVKLTAAGQRVHERAQRVLRDTHAIKAMSLDARDSQRGTLSIATTHTQARYVLPPVIREFREKYPQVRVHLHQGTSEQIAEMLASGHVDIAVATGSREQFADCVLLPCYEWHRRVVVPRAQPAFTRKEERLVAGDGLVAVAGDKPGCRAALAECDGEPHVERGERVDVRPRSDTTRGKYACIGKSWHAAV